MDAEVHSKIVMGRPKSGREASGVMDSEMMVRGAIVDSWVEPSHSQSDPSRLVLQIAPTGRPRELLIVEAEANLVSDRCWLADLGENLCHGSLIAAVGRVNLSGFLSATQLLIGR